MRPNKLKRFKGWLLVKRTLLLELFRPRNRVILIVSDNRSTVGIAYPRLYESIAFINGYKKADEAIEQLKTSENSSIYPKTLKISTSNLKKRPKNRAFFSFPRPQQFTNNRGEPPTFPQNWGKLPKKRKTPEKKGLKNLLIWHIIKT